MIKRFIQDEGGAALTEFVIGLPIFLIIFSGMGSLYRLHQVNLHTIKQANYEIWKVSETYPAKSYSPITGGISSLTRGGGSVWSKVTNLASVGGIYKESYVQTIIPSSLPGTDIDPKMNIEKITDLVDGSPSRNLLNDEFDVSGLSGGGFDLGTVLDVFFGMTGTRLSLAAGIRYGDVNAGYSPSSVTVSGVSYQPKSLNLTLPVNTKATHRIFPVAMVRLEHLREEVLRSSILVFDDDMDYPDNPDWIENSKSPSLEEDPEKEKCVKQIQKDQKEYDKCISTQRASYPNGPLTKQDQDAINNACKDKKPDTSCLK